MGQAKPQKPEQIRSCASEWGTDSVRVPGEGSRPMEIWTGNASLRRQPEFPRREHAHDVETQVGGAEVLPRSHVVETLISTDSTTMLSCQNWFVVDIVECLSCGTDYHRSGPFSTPNHPPQGCVPTWGAGMRPPADDEEAWEPKRASKAVVPPARSPRRWWPNRGRPGPRAGD